MIKSEEVPPSPEKKRKHQEDIKHLLKQIREPGITPETLLSNGEEAGSFAVQYLRKIALYNYARRKQSTNKKRGRPKKVATESGTCELVLVKRKRGRPRKETTQIKSKTRKRAEHVVTSSNNDPAENAV